MVPRMSRTIASILLLAATTTGCLASASDEDPGTIDQAELGSRWSSIMHCGGLVIDVNPDARQLLQAVVSDPNAVHWLSSHPGDGGAGTQNAKHEVILQGAATRGVFHPGDFTQFTQSGYAVADAFLPEAFVRREGSGVRVQLVSWASGHQIETSNWWFGGCH